MASFIIEGGHRLKGEITPQGAKNEVLQILCATLLTQEKVTVHNIPDILDVNNLITMMRSMGVVVERLGMGSFTFQAANIDESYLKSDEFLKLCSSLRGSVMLMGPLLARFGHVLIKYLDFVMNPEVYAYYSAPWYTDIVVTLILTTIMVLITTITYFIVGHLIKKRDQKERC